MENIDERKRIEEEISEQEDWTGSEKLVISQFKPDLSLEGKSLEEIATSRGKSRESVMCDMMLEARKSIQMILFFGWEEDLHNIMIHHLMMVGSDGSSLADYGRLGKGTPHPRSYGAFTRFLGRYVIRVRVMSIDEGDEE